MNIYNVIILDESGSMSSIYHETIASMNEVLSGIRRDQEEHPEQQNYVTIVTFEGSGIEGVKTRRDRVPIDRIKNFTEKDYHPGGCTPLYDAMGKTLSKMEKRVYKTDRVLATVITDGMENSSEGQRDQENYRVLLENGWQVIVVWECQLKPRRIEHTMHEVERLLNEKFLSIYRKRTPVTYNG